MHNPPEVLAIIPARGGSKGLPRKNIVDLGGKPLIAWSILAARHAQRVSRVIVSTEDQEIAEVAREWGAEVPFLRPAELAGDEANVGDALAYTVNQLGGHGPGRAFVTLYPTSPFRTPVFIDEMLHVLFSGYDSVMTVKEVHIDPEYAYIKSRESQKLINLYGENGRIPPWKTYYRPYAVFHATWPQKTDRHYYHVIRDKCMLIDIDTPKDLRWAEAVIRNELFDFGFE